MRPRIATLSALTLALLLTSIPGCGGDNNNPVVPPVPKELDSASLGPNDTFSHTFANAGTYNYHCKFHGGMNGSVTVATGQGATASVSITDNSFGSPVSVAPGGMVTWTNNGSNAHTVTSN